MALSIHGTHPLSVFRLSGADENSATFALGWALEQSRSFRRAFVDSVFDQELDVEDALITLQEHGDDGGFTDLEVLAGRRFHLVLEAKRWSDVPTIEQLARYQPRLVASGAKRKRLVSVSAAERSYALRELPDDLDGIPIAHLSWGDLRSLAEKARAQASGFEERLWLRELIEHLGEFGSMQRQIDNNVFVVSLGRNPMVEGQPHTWIDVVEKDGCYFHPVGKNWPVQPPNYVGFRYHGQLQSVHHVDSFAIVENLADYNPLWPESKEERFVYRLGPPMRPAQVVKTGGIFRNGRVWCAIDTLLSGAFETISDARDETQRRKDELL